MKYSVKSILFLGIGGISMHQLAIAMKNLGAKVYGYDLHKSKYTSLCVGEGIEVCHKFNKDICNVDLCVKTGAINNGKFFNFLKKNNIPIIDRADLLGWFCTKFKQVIAVAGTHGKSTTASLIYEILRSSGKKVSCHIGADVKNSRFNIKDDILVVEACEFNKSFLKLKPTISVVTNVEREHMDSYGTLFNLRSAFLTFIKRGEKRFVYGEKSTKFLNKYGNINFVERVNLKIKPKLKGEHNLKNISLAVAVCKDLGVEEQVINDVVGSFSGIPRRHEFLGEYNKSKIYIDYAHHPTEVKAFIQTFLEQHKNPQIIFQPHTYSRTKTFLKDFISVFMKVENLIIYKEYSAREKQEQGLSAKDLYLQVKKHNAQVKYCDNKKSLLKLLKEDSVISFVGAGDINLIAESLVTSIKK